MFALVDCNNFYASCERVFRPELNNRPIAILSNNDGCVISRSDETKALGIPMGAPAFKYKNDFKTKGITVFSSNYPLYGDMSRRIMNILSTFTPDMEVYSIDEAFLKFEGYDLYNINQYGCEIRRKITKSTGIPISIGFAHTKTLSKLANKIARKFPEKTNNVYVIDTEEKRIKAIKWAPIESVWGIGRGLSKLLKAKNIKTAYDFTCLSDEWVRKNTSVVGLRLKHELEGKPTLTLEDHTTRKAIATTRSFEEMYTNYDDIKERISTFAASCAEKLRNQQSHCNAIMVMLHTNRHRKDLAQYRKSIIIKTEYPTNSTIDIVNYAIKGVKDIFKENHFYKRAGVIVFDLTPENTKQIALFTSENPRHYQLMKVIDQVNKNIGNHRIKLACQDLERTWKMNQNLLSSRYTTNLSEIITVKA
ncbi:MAG: Y-family DNA polymerase [Flavobacteriaceae bacterium]|nr:Y-family DNA polymerase [Flavobacteriaceae bacterium]